jgi:hypothetical protein
VARPSLSAAQEVELGKRIEAGQRAVLFALAAVPVAVKTLLDLADRVQRREIPRRLIVFPETQELSLAKVWAFWPRSAVSGQARGGD